MGESMLPKHINNISLVLRNAKIEYRNAKEALTWTKKTIKRFNRLIKLSHSTKNILITNDEELPSPYIDVYIKLPNFFRSFNYRWVFSIITIDDLLSVEDPAIVAYKLHRNGIKINKWDDPCEIKRLINLYRNNVKVFPYITFDNVIMSKKEFNKNDIIEGTKLWLKKYFPEMSTWDVTFIDPEVALNN